MTYVELLLTSGEQPNYTNYVPTQHNMATHSTDHTHPTLLYTIEAKLEIATMRVVVAF
jgi:hypothetical protein